MLFEIRDDNELISRIDGNIKVGNLIRRADEARLDLDESDEEWIIAIWNRGTTSLRRRHLGRLTRCCVQLGELELHAISDVARRAGEFQKWNRNRSSRAVSRRH